MKGGGGGGGGYLGTSEFRSRGSLWGEGGRGGGSAGTGGGRSTTVLPLRLSSCYLTCPVVLTTCVVEARELNRLEFATSRLGVTAVELTLTSNSISAAVAAPTGGGGGGCV